MREEDQRQSRCERPHNYYFEIFLVSLAALLLEVGYTRVFSYKLFYFFTYLIIGVALLGLGAGSVGIAVVPRLRSTPLPRLVTAGCTFAATSAGVGYFVVAKTRFSTFQMWSSPEQLARLAAIVFVLFLSFAAIGIVVAALLSRRPAPVNRLYFADLSGAALGAALVVPIMALTTPPATVMAGGVVLCAAAVWAGRREERGVAKAAAAIGLVLLAGVSFPGSLPDPFPDESKTMHEYAVGEKPTFFSQWSPVFRIDVTDVPGKGDEARIIHHDGLWGSTLHRYDGDVSSLSRFDRDERAFAFKVSDKSPEDVLIIGAAGGHEILAALYFGADPIEAVELNPATVSLLTTHFADYTGHIPDDPRVHLVTGEGRSYLAKQEGEYDLIFFVAPDSYSAMNAATAGAFVLTESYLYTVEMIKESVEHLRDTGLIAMHFGEVDYEGLPNRTARYLITARQAFAELGIENFERHVLVATTEGFMSTSTMLLKKTPFTPEEIGRFLPLTKEIADSKARYVPGHVREDNPVTMGVTLDSRQLDRWLGEYEYDIGPVTDDSPFFWHFARFRSVFARALARFGAADDAEVDLSDSLGERVLLFLLAFSAMFAALFLLAPFVFIRSVWTELPYKGRSGIYFATLGLGFMFFEISLIQKLTLFLGYPTYSLTVTLAGMLVFAGLGSLASERYVDRRNAAVLCLFAVLACLAMFYQLTFDGILERFLTASLTVRIAIAVLSLAPLGLVLGAFMPLGLAGVAALTSHGDEYVAWGWAVNGFCSVIGSVLTTLLSMAYGFDAVLGLAILLYGIATVAIRGLPARPAP